MNSQRFEINNFDESGVVIRLISDSHSLDDFNFKPIDILNNELNRLCKEIYWIHPLDTLHPEGLNSKVLDNVKYIENY